MQYIISDTWKEYALLDCGDGEKLERWGKYILRRPEPQAMWEKLNEKLWSKADALYHRSEKGGGHWEFLKEIPGEWSISYGDLNFGIKPMAFKHTGLFPEQGANWDFMREKIAKAKREVNVLNLFAYTGGATVACAKEGAHVTHVDASKGMVYTASENAERSNIGKDKIRWIVDDVVKFVEREIKRGKKYDGIVMDPPSYGRGASGEVWRAEEDLYKLISRCTELLSDSPIFFIVNSYTTGFSPMCIRNMVELTVMKKVKKATVEYGEVGLPLEKSDLVLPCGIVCRVSDFKM